MSRGIALLVSSIVTGLALFAWPLATPLGAQASDLRRVAAMPQLEWRADATAARTPDAHVGVGVNARAGWYVRVGAGLAAGATRGRDDIWRASQRAELALRFHLDPFGERRRGVYGGAGVAARFVDGRSRPVLTLIAGVEGATRGRWVPALELVVGGGVRAGVALRRTRGDSSR